MNPKDDPQESQEPVERLLCQALELSGAERDQTIEELCREYPEHAHELRERLRRVDAFLNLAPDVPERLGEFVLGERLGGGGMGVVYRAEQTSLGRTVALKLIRPEHLYFDHARARFRRETEAIAKLQHRGIVTIHVVGEEHGLPYFAMELLEGRTLAEIVDDLSGRAPESLRASDMFGAAVPQELGPAWVPACLLVVLRVAQALDHAHQHGLLHRDVKPSNIMLVPGEPPRVVLLDFGLTGAFDHEAGDAELRTGSGVQLGTLAYMPPEQVEGSRDLGPRSDVYSLGVTLYELLTLRRPFRGETRTAVQERILEGAPASIRARNPLVPTDVEIVCRHAMSARPGERYADASAFARDLDNVLAGRPIEARPPGPLELALRTVRRYPARTAAVLLGIALVVGLPTGLLLQERRYSGGLERALIAEEEAKNAAFRAEADAAAARDRANDQFREAEDVLGYFLNLFEVASRETDSTVVSVRELLDIGAAGLGERLVDRPSAHARIQVAIASAYSVMGFAEEALPLAQAALDVLREDSERPELFGQALTASGQSLFQRGHSDEARERLREALDVLGPLAPEHTELRVESAMSLAQVVLDVGDRSESRELMQAAEAWARADPAVDPAMLAEVLSNRALVELFVGERQLSKELLDEALSILEELADRKLAVRCSTFNHLGLWYNEIGDLEQAEHWYRRSVDLAVETLGPESPVTLTYRSNHALTLIQRGRRDEGLERLLEVERGLLKKRLPNHPEVLLINSHIVSVLATLGRLDEVIARLESVLPRMEGTYDPGRYELPANRRDLANAYRAAGRHDDAAPLEAQAAAEFGRFAGQEFEAPPLYLRAAQQRIEAGDLDRVDELLFELFDLFERVPSLRVDGISAETFAAMADEVGLGAEAEALRSSGRVR